MNESKKIHSEKNGIDQNDYDFSFKISIVGSNNVGKSTLVQGDELALDGTPPEDSPFGVRFRLKLYQVKDKKYRVQYWECPGSRRDLRLANMLCCGSVGILYMFDLCNQQSFHDLTKWIESTRKESTSLKPGIIVGNKMDMEVKSRKVGAEEAKRLANQFNLKYIEVSALYGTNVAQTFETLLDDIIRRIPNPCTTMQFLETGISPNTRAR